MGGDFTCAVDDREELSAGVRMRWARLVRPRVPSASSAGMSLGRHRLDEAVRWGWDPYGQVGQFPGELRKSRGLCGPVKLTLVTGSMRGQSIGSAPRVPTPRWRPLVPRLCNRQLARLTAGERTHGSVTDVPSGNFIDVAVGLSQLRHRARAPFGRGQDTSGAVETTPWCPGSFTQISVTGTAPVPWMKTGRSHAGVRAPADLRRAAVQITAGNNGDGWAWQPMARLTAGDRYAELSPPSSLVLD